MKIVLIVFLLLTLVNIYGIYKQIIKIKKQKVELCISFVLLILTIVIEYNILGKNELNLWLLLIYILLNIIYFSYIIAQKEIKDYITNQSIKEAIDLSNSGILVLKNKNTIKLQNSIMRDLLSKLSIKKNYIEELKNKAQNTISGDYTIVVDNKAWLFIINKEDLEIVAVDINEEYNLQQKIETQNREIEENNKEIIWTIENMEYIEKQKESQELKSKFHDLLGQSFSMLQQYLNQDNLESKNIEDIKFMIREMFTNMDDEEDAEINLKNLVEAHKNTGTEINIVGKLPKNKEVAKVFFEIIREAVTNAIRHADSTKVDVQIKDNLDGIELIITNNGKKPKDIIIEHQGIKGMRRRVEKIKGNLYITTVPNFKIEVKIG